MNDRGHRLQRLWLALRLEDLPLSALEVKTDASQPIVVVEKQRVVYASPKAASAGVELDMDITTAQVLSGCHGVARDHPREELALHSLCEQLYQFTPHIDIHRSGDGRQAGILLEISTCLNLFGGACALTQKITEFMRTTAHAVVIGFAHTAEAAWLLSFQPQPITGQETADDFVQRLNQLSIQLLVDYPKAVDALDKTGFSTLGDVVKQTRATSLASFTKRVGKDFAQYISDIYSLDHDFSQGSLFAKPVSTYRPDDFFFAEVQFDYPVSVVDQLHGSIEHLLQQLTDYLRARQLECQHIEWQLRDIYHRQESINIHSDVPQTHWQLLYDLTLIQLESRELPFEVDCLQLMCNDAMAVQAHTQTLDFNGGKKRRASVQDTAITFAKLKARLGEAAVYKVSFEDGHLPEITNKIISVAEKACQQLPEVHRQALRPTWLLAPPEPIETRRSRLYWRGYLTLVAGPDRISGHWWDESIVRDYFLAQRHDNVPLWIYWDLHAKAWYVHGVFA